MPQSAEVATRRRRIVLAGVLLALVFLIAATRADAHHRCWHQSDSCPPAADPDPAGDTSTLVPPVVGERSVTRPPGSPALADADAAARVRRSLWEPRPQNYAANHRIPTAAELAAFHEAQAALDPWNVNPYAQRVTGNFTGTTDEIIQWAAHKWGIDEDIVRAVAVQESEWRQDGVHADGDHHSYGILQVLSQYAGTVPLSRESTPFNADFYGAHIRFVFDGLNRWFNDVPHGRVYAAGDIWGSVGSWFAGAWWTSAAASYIDGVKDHLADRTWEQPSF